MSEELSPQSEKMDISDTSIDQQSETELLDNNEHCTKPEQLSLTSITTATTAANKTISKSTVTNSHPLMYSPESDVLPITNYNFNPIAHSSTLNLVRSSSFDLDCPDIESYRVELPEFPSSPSALKKNFDFPVEIDPDLSDTENDRSVYEAVLSPNLQNVSLTMNEKQSGNLNFLAQVSRSNKLRKIKVVPTTQSGDSDVSSIDSVSDSIKSDDVFPENRSLDMNFIKELLESPDIDDSVLEPPEYVRTENESKPGESPAEPIHEYSAEEERRESRHWQKIVLPNGEQRNIDMRVIEPYKRVMSHGGYLKAGGHNAIIVFSACYLPDKSRKDYVYVMDNLFLYVLQTLDQLITEDYVLVYLHGSASSNCIPTIGWLKRCYQLIDRRLRKNLKQLYLVHPTFWIKTVIMMTKPFISTKFYRKLHFINSIQELTNCLPIEQAAIPERVINYDKVKFST